MGPGPAASTRAYLVRSTPPFTGVELGFTPTERRGENLQEAWRPVSCFGGPVSVLAKGVASSIPSCL